MGKIDRSIIGKRFGRLVVVDLDHINNHKTYWLCRCDCGNQKVIERAALTSGRTVSCGCYFKERFTKHGLSRSRLYNIWYDMRERCDNINSDKYQHYGARGISICDDWKKFEPFAIWSLQHGYSDDLTIDRIDGSDGYSPDNCRWVDWYIQANNTSRNHRVTYNGDNRTIGEWARLFGVKYGSLWARIRRGDMRDFINYFDGQSKN